VVCPLLSLLSAPYYPHYYPHEQTSDEQLVYRFDKPQPDGRTQLRLTPLELLVRLAA